MTALTGLGAAVLISDGCIYKVFGFGGIKILHSCDPELGLSAECWLAAVTKHVFSLMNL